MYQSVTLNFVDFRIHLFARHSGLFGESYEVSVIVSRSYKTSNDVKVAEKPWPGHFFP